MASSFPKKRAKPSKEDFVLSNGMTVRQVREVLIKWTAAAIAYNKDCNERYLGRTEGGHRRTDARRKALRKEADKTFDVAHKALKAMV